MIIFFFKKMISMDIQREIIKADHGVRVVGGGKAVQMHNELSLKIFFGLIECIFRSLEQIKMISIILNGENCF